METDFTLCDCNGSQSTHYYTVDEDGLYIFDGVTADTPEAQPPEGGVVTGKNTTEGGGIYVHGSTFTMEGGTIAGNDTDFGGGTFVYDSTFTMKGGTIVGNNADFGGGVYAQSTTATIKGNASIAGNLSQYGGGIYIYYESTPYDRGECRDLGERIGRLWRRYFCQYHRDHDDRRYDRRE